MYIDILYLWMCGNDHACAPRSFGLLVDFVFDDEFFFFRNCPRRQKDTCRCGSWGAHHRIQYACKPQRTDCFILDRAYAVYERIGVFRIAGGSSFNRMHSLFVSFFKKNDR